MLPLLLAVEAAPHPSHHLPPRALAAAPVEASGPLHAAPLSPPPFSHGAERPDGREESKVI